jgi:hypothetical protein
MLEPCIGLVNYLISTKHSHKFLHSLFLDPIKMVKQFIIASLLITSMGSYAQNKKNSQNSIEKHAALNNTFQKGQLDVNIGIGLFANRYYYYYRNSRVSPPLQLSVEKAVTSNFSVGGYLAYVRAVYTNSGYYWYYDQNNIHVYAPYNDKVTLTYGVLGARAAFHLAEYIQVENLDVYGGGMLGWSFAKFKYTTDNAVGRAVQYKTTGYGGFLIGAYVGGRYRFTEKVGIYGEISYGLSYANFGLNLKF